MRILEIVHGFRPTAQGGAELYAEQHARTLAHDFGDELRIFTREADLARPDYEVREEARDGLRITWVNNTFRAATSFEETYRNAAILDRFESLADAFQPDIAHIHHLSCLSTDILESLGRRRVPTVFTLHDYWMFCFRGQLLDAGLARCSGPTVGGCSDCLRGHAARGPKLRSVARLVKAAASRLPGRAAEVMKRVGARATEHLAREDDLRRIARLRIAEMTRLCLLVDRYLAPSHRMKAQFERFGIPAERVLHSGYGIDHRPYSGLRREPATKLRIGFVGSLMVSKGPAVLLEAFRGLPPESAMLELYGAFVPYHGDSSYRQILDSLLDQPGVSSHGPTSPQAIPEILARLDVLVVPSIWEENSPIVIREGFLAGLPIVGSRVGGIPELVEHGRNGLLVPPGDARALRAALLRLIEEPGLLAALRAGLPAVRTIEDDVASTRSLYEALLSQRPRRSLPAG